LPTDLSGREVRAARERPGFTVRRHAGSHMILGRENPHAGVVVPDHRQIRIGTLRHIVPDAGPKIYRFAQLLGR